MSGRLMTKSSWSPGATKMRRNSYGSRAGRVLVAQDRPETSESLRRIDPNGSDPAVRNGLGERHDCSVDPVCRRDLAGPGPDSDNRIAKWPFRASSAKRWSGNGGFSSAQEARCVDRGGCVGATLGS